MKWHSSKLSNDNMWPHVNFKLLAISADRGPQRCIVYGLSEKALVKCVRGDVAGVFDVAQLGAWPDLQLGLSDPWEC